MYIYICILCTLLISDATKIAAFNDHRPTSAMSFIKLNNHDRQHIANDHLGQPEYAFSANKITMDCDSAFCCFIKPCSTLYVVNIKFVKLTIVWKIINNLVRAL